MNDEAKTEMNLDETPLGKVHLPPKPTIRERIRTSKARLQAGGPRETPGKAPGRPATASDTPKPEANPVAGAQAASGAIMHSAVPVKQRIIYACGHEDSNRACPACQRAAKARNQAKAHARQHAKRDQDLGRPGRLPDGSNYNVSYDAATQTWSGRLLIQEGKGNAGTSFTAVASGVFKLLTALDAHYRAWLEEQKGP